MVSNVKYEYGTILEMEIKNYVVLYDEYFIWLRHWISSFLLPSLDHS